MTAFLPTRAIDELAPPVPPMHPAKSRKVSCRIAADFAMHGQIGGHYRQAGRHRLDQRMRERFRVGWGHIKVAGAIEMMQRSIRHRSEFYNALATPEIVYQR